MNEQISILGTGWLGLPLAKAFVEENYVVKGSTTSENKLENLRNHKIKGYQISLNEEGPVGDINSFLSGSDTLIINIPPGLRKNPEINFVAKIQTLLPHIEKSDIENVLFISSTSVFPDLEGFPSISEETTPNATSNAGKQLIGVEQLLQNHKGFKTTILRFAGLFGPNRHPATMLSRRSNIKNPEAPVNLIHLDDCIGIINQIIRTQRWGYIFNASYPDHPEKSKYYGKICKEMGLPLPDYDFQTPSKGKLVKSDKIEHSLKYRFKRNLDTI
ncbi:NAD-dependent epimerase/dehydratase family protein [Aquimarina gracilis]|uniref:NAD-dependent epimerase/dehydratase family protein n=1 Tax=Aquimarina gracilis TaxID=874422 RepID=A0ABU5ZZM4_9FLAO|nr:NAD-dependent epimerase/dehydratase family protein [Aquimarina gracilis]MEB3347335.1 NAD-dependent epimerase/dehydratase family protein [Aquimarina gracilis]